MGKKDAAKMEAQKDAFMSGCKARGIPEKKATKVFEFIEYFAGYGFNKSHSTTYALLAYQTAYLKANYPRHFMAALLTIESQSSDKVALYLAECRELGVPMLPPDVNESQWQFVVQPDGVRFGLGAIKGAGEGAIQSILDARAALGGKIASLFALSEHLDLRLVNKKVLECLVKSGALDSLAPGGRETYLAWRPRVLAGIDRILDHGNRHQRDRDQGQSLLFAGHADDDGPVSDDAALAPARAWSEGEALAFEKEALGLYMSGHPLQKFAAILDAAGARKLETLPQSAADVAIAGCVTGLRPLKTKRGDRMCVFMLEEDGGKVEAVVFPEAFQKFGGLVVDDALLLVRGKFERDDDAIRMVVAEITPLDVIRERAVREVEITLAGRGLAKQVMRDLLALLDKHTGDRRVSLVVELNGQANLRVRAATARRVRPSDWFVRDVEALVGAGSVSLKDF